MGTCGERETNLKKKIIIKVEKSKKSKKKNKHKIEEINCEIIDTINNHSVEKLIKNNITLSELLTLADYNIQGDLDIQLRDSTRLNDDLNTNMKDIMDKYFPGVNLLSISILVTIKGLSIPSNIKNAYQEMSTLIGNPFFDNFKIFGISVYDTKKITMESFYFDKTENPEIIKYNSFSSYCSAKGVLYISGGENETEDIDKEPNEFNNFISIDLHKLDNFNLYLQELPKLIVKRSWHSMIFIPNQYIFIVGGINTKTVEIYDIDEKRIYLDSELKETRCEPTMCLVNNIYLYAFCGFYPLLNFNENIERCNLLKNKREWEYIEYSNKISASFFGVSYYKDDEILLISSKDNQDDDNKSYSVKIGKDEDSSIEINEIVLQYNDMRTFKDKLFYPVTDEFSANLPLIVGENKPVLILNIETGDIECKNYK